MDPKQSVVEGLYGTAGLLKDHGTRAIALSFH